MQIIDKWEIDKISGLTDRKAEVTRKNGKISERLVIPQESHIFKWVEPALIR
jgi:acyl-[acyl-carrier-protein] desaturase